MTATIVFALLFVGAVCYGIVIHHALTVSLEERERFFTPVEPPKVVEWDYASENAKHLGYVDADWVSEGVR